jgi:heterotetrameric sarcosine oxidase delta subunit
MSIRITCPNCGTRAVEEWVYGEVFAVPDEIADPDERDIDRGFMHNNPEGPVREAWFHLYGCRRWIYLTRDTTTDHILSIE